MKILVRRGSTLAMLTESISLMEAGKLFIRMEIDMRGHGARAARSTERPVEPKAVAASVAVVLSEMKMEVVDQTETPIEE